MKTLIVSLALLSVGAGAQPGASRWDPFLDTLEQRTIRWFLKATPEATGLTPDRWPSKSPSSIAAVGFALTVYPIAAERHMITRQEAARRVHATLDLLLRAPQNDGPAAAGYRGFFYHFVALADGTRAWNCELSTIDTALLMAGILCAESYFDRHTVGESAIRAEADSLYRRVDWTWSAEGRPGMMLGWTPEHGADRNSWHGYNEAMIMYVLALGSPTHPVEPVVWKYWTSSYVWARYYDWEFVSFGPLFGHQYSHCWIDYRGIQDQYMKEKGIDYFENSRRATCTQQRYGAENPHGFRGYSADVWGVTACDGPGDTAFQVGGIQRQFIGYGGRGVSFDWSLDDGTLAPTGAGGSVAFAPEICIPALKEMARRYDGRLWKEYGFVDAFNPTFVTEKTGESGWFDVDYLGIDQGPIAIMIENLRNGFVWNLMKRNPYIAAGLRRAGFTGGWLDRR
jgi:hypothetical protein